MTREDLFDWIDYHASRFPSFPSTFSKLRDRAKDYAIDRMMNDFEGIPLRQLKKSTDRMANWDNPPKTEMHVRTIARLAREQCRTAEPELDDMGRPKVNCHRCRDTGLAEIFVGCLPGVRQRFLDRYFVKDETKRRVSEQQVLCMTTTVPCICGISKRRNDWLKDNDENVVYAPQSWKEMAENQRKRIMIGPDLYVAAGWNTKPEEF